MTKFNYIETTSDKLDTIPIQFGNYIIITDKPAIYYDTHTPERIQLNNSNINTLLDVIVVDWASGSNGTPTWTAIGW